MNNSRKVILSSIGIFSVVSLVATLSINLLSGAAFSRETYILIDTVNARTKNIKSIARFDKEHLVGGSGDFLIAAAFMGCCPPTFNYARKVLKSSSAGAALLLSYF